MITARTQKTQKGSVSYTRLFIHWRVPPVLSRQVCPGLVLKENPSPDWGSGTSGLVMFRVQTGLGYPSLPNRTRDTTLDRTMGPSPRGTTDYRALCLEFSSRTFLLQPASEGWGKVLFSVCLSVHTLTGGGTPAKSGWWGGTPVRSGWRGRYLARS